MINTLAQYLSDNELSQTKASEMTGIELTRLHRLCTMPQANLLSKNGLKFFEWAKINLYLSETLGNELAQSLFTKELNKH